MSRSEMSIKSNALLADAINEIKNLHDDLEGIARELNEKHPHRAGVIVVRALRSSRKIVAEIEANAHLTGPMGPGGSHD